jgi:integrase
VNGGWDKKALSTSITEARRQRDDLLKEIMVYGNIQKPQTEDNSPLFGEVTEKWAKIKETQIKASTMRDYRSTMNLYVLPRFGNCPINDIT